MAEPKPQPVDEKLREKLAKKMEQDFDGHDWYGTELDAKSDPIQDPGTGKKLVIRRFDFRMNKDVKGFPDNKQELFNAHAKQIETILWSDGLKPFDYPPKLTIDAHKRTYKIVVVAEPRHGTVVLEQPSSLNDLLNPKNATTGHKK